jgi:hypothetical protein
MPNKATTPKYPNVIVEMNLDGPDGNAFAIMARVGKALRHAGASGEEISQYTMDSMSGDYENLLAAANRWVDFRV